MAKYSNSMKSGERQIVLKCSEGPVQEKETWSYKTSMNRDACCNLQSNLKNN